MGQKINPTGFRLSVSRDWASRWYANARNYPVMLNEDLRVREYLGRRLRNASVGRVVIERPARNARITIHSARPGVVIGKKGEDIEQLKGDLQRLMGVPVHVNIEEIRKPEIDAQLIADSITQQLERRIMFRRAMKRAMQNAMRLGAQGIKIMSSGRLNGIEIARTEWYREGRVPLHTLRADIQYGFSTAVTTYGIIGVKVWVYKGDTLGRNDLAPADKDPPLEREERKQRKSPGPRTLPPGRPAPRRKADGADTQGAGSGQVDARVEPRSDARGDSRTGGRGDGLGDGRSDGRGLAPGAVRGEGAADARRPSVKRVRRADDPGGAAGGSGAPGPAGGSPPPAGAGQRAVPGGAPGANPRPGPGFHRGPRPASDGPRGGPVNKGPGGGRSN
jgi:small subunit ribosomal protein S3